MRVRLKQINGRRVDVPGLSRSGVEQLSDHEFVCAVIFTREGKDFLLSDKDGIPLLVSADLVEVADSTIPGHWTRTGAIAGTDVIEAIGYPYLLSSYEAWRRTFELHPEGRAELARVWGAQRH